jgi:hypothetical protein
MTFGFAVLREFVVRWFFFGIASALTRRIAQLPRRPVAAVGRAEPLPPRLRGRTRGL